MFNGFRLSLQGLAQSGVFDMSCYYMRIWDQYE